MTLVRERYEGPISFQCDTCNEIDETHTVNFHGAIAKLKSHGWKISKQGDDWVHYCKDCHDG